MAGLLRECKLCRKLFTGGKVCQDCIKYLDEIYPTVRTYIRDSSNPRLEVSEIAEALDIPMRFVQGLVDNGYLGRDLPSAKFSDDEDTSGKDRLANELSKATEQLRAHANAKKSVTYGQERYSTGRK